MMCVRGNSNTIPIPLYVSIQPPTAVLKVQEIIYNQENDDSFFDMAFHQNYLEMLILLSKHLKVVKCSTFFVKSSLDVYCGTLIYVLSYSIQHTTANFAPDMLGDFFSRSLSQRNMQRQG